MLALHRAGRRGEALEVFRATRAVLAEQLGIEPGPDLQRLHEAILRGDEDSAQASAIHVIARPDQAITTRAPALAGASGPLPVPRQLPADVPIFTGRKTQLDRLDRLLASGWESGSKAAVISAIAGTAGVGKTALAVHWAHQVADRFPDGQLYVNLRGFDPGGAADPAEAVRGFLDALGVPAPRIPADLDGPGGAVPQPARRPADAGRAGQRPRRRAGPAAAARRARLPGPGDQPQPAGRPGRRAKARTRSTLDLLPRPRPGSCWPAGSARSGWPPSPRPSTRSSTAARGCRSPWPSSPPGPRPTRALSASHARRANCATPGRGSTCSTGGDAGDRRAGGVLLVLPGAEPGRRPAVPAARPASRARTSPRRPRPAWPACRPRQARRLLAELTRAHLLAEHRPGRYRFHDLLRAYATELADARQPTPTGARPPPDARPLPAHRRAPPTACSTRLGRRWPLASVQPGVVPDRPDDQRAALAWFAADYARC